MRTRRIVAVAACIVGGMAFTTAADARLIRYTGTTNQGHKALLKTNAKGKAQYLSVRFQPVCREGRMRQVTHRFVAPFRKADYTGFVDAGHHRYHYKKYDTVGKVRIRVEGERVDRNRIRGRLKSRIRYFDHGEQFNSCHAPGIRFTVRRHRSA